MCTGLTASALWLQLYDNSASITSVHEVNTHHNPVTWDTPHPLTIKPGRKNTKMYRCFLIAYIMILYASLDPTFLFHEHKPIITAMNVPMVMKYITLWVWIQVLKLCFASSLNIHHIIKHSNKSIYLNNLYILWSNSKQFIELEVILLCQQQRLLVWQEPVNVKKNYHLQSEGDERVYSY